MLEVRDSTREQHLDRVVCRFYPLMTSAEEEKFPSVAVRMQHGPVVMVPQLDSLQMLLTTEPQWEEYKDLKEPSKSKDVKPLPGRFALCQDSSAVWAAMKREWHFWVDNPKHGARPEQVAAFGLFLDTLHPNVESYLATREEDVGITPDMVWHLHTIGKVLAAAPPAVVGDGDALVMRQLAGYEDMRRPQADLAYGTYTVAMSTRAVRDFEARKRTYNELQASATACQGIQKGTFLLARTSPEGKETLEWWIAEATEDVPAMTREQAERTVTKVIWMFASSCGDTASMPNDLNGSFRRYLPKNLIVDGKEVANRGNHYLAEQIEVGSIAMINMALKKPRAVKKKRGQSDKFPQKPENAIRPGCTKETLKAIADLNIGFSYNDKTSKLDYHVLADNALDDDDSEGAAAAVGRGGGVGADSGSKRGVAALGGGVGAAVRQRGGAAPVDDGSSGGAAAIRQRGGSAAAVGGRGKRKKGKRHEDNSSQDSYSDADESAKKMRRCC